MSKLNLLVFLLAIATFLPSLDRLRHLNWKTAKAAYVLMHLAFAFWSLGVAYESIQGDAAWYQILGLIGILIWFVISQKTWSGGNPPPHAMRHKR